MRVVSLFAGIGGFDLGFERAGAKTVATVEIDPRCRKLLADKWPDAVHLDDVRTAGRHNLPECDVITFGFPCQDLSVAGKREGLKGERSGLFYEAMRIVDELKPAWAVWENVPGLLSSDNGRDLARVLFRLGESGYFGCVRCIDAQWLGVAQRRRRLFGVFTRLDSGAERCAEILSIAESLRGHPAPSREAEKSVADNAEGSVRGSSVRCLNPWDYQSTRQYQIDGAYRTLDAGNSAGGQAHGVCYALQGNGIDRADTAGCNGAGWREGECYTLNTIDRPAVCYPIDSHQQDSRFKVCADGISPTLPGQMGTGGNNGPMVLETAKPPRKYIIRRLTPLECCRLQGFPDNWTAGFSDSVRYRMLGNAVCVNVAEWVAKRLVKATTKKGNTGDKAQ